MPHLRATGVTVYLENGGRLEHAQQMVDISRPGPRSFTTGLTTVITVGEDDDEYENEKARMQ
ncbi:MAG: hypothetical protein WB586_01630 [Chthoniobacterales bacterium]